MVVLCYEGLASAHVDDRVGEVADDGLVHVVEELGRDLEALVARAEVLERLGHDHDLRDRRDRRDRSRGSCGGGCPRRRRRRRRGCAGGVDGGWLRWRCRCVCDWCSLLRDCLESGQLIDREWLGECAFDDCFVEVRLCVPKVHNGNLLVDGDPIADELTGADDRVEQVAAVQ